MSTRILTGSALSWLETLPSKSVHTCITSPPYWGLRTYGEDTGMIGLEPTFAEHLAKLMEVFAEVERVLRDDGTLWLNYGDAYTSGGRKDSPPDSLGGPFSEARASKERRAMPPGLKPKDLMMMPARVAIAMQDAGWYLRSEIVWHKKNPMPESVTDRPTCTHEKMFLLSKSPRYFYDADAVRVPQSQSTLDRFGGDRAPRKASVKEGGSARKTNEFDKATPDSILPNGANLRNVWSIATHAYSDAHFATFPPKLIEPCIKAGTSERGVCGECGAPWVRSVTSRKEKSDRKPTGKALTSPRTDGSSWNENGGRGFMPVETATTGWTPSCTCDAEVVPATVLDPFGGSGTVGLVADRMRRNSVLIDINKDYAAMAHDRIYNDAPLLVDIQTGTL